MSNVYHDELTKRGHMALAGSLLGLMRPKVEKILKKVIPDDSTPSQSLRAVRAIKYIEVSELPVLMQFEDKSGWAEAHRDRRTLEDFLSVHRTVWILEGRAI